MTHELKTWPDFYAKVRSGEKPFEVRKNDRDFKVGDVLHLHEWSPEKGYSGNSMQIEITYILNDSKWGILPGTVIMGLSRLPIATIDVTIDQHPKMVVS